MTISARRLDGGTLTAQVKRTDRKVVLGVSAVAGRTGSLSAPARLAAWSSLQETALNLRRSAKLIDDALRSFDARDRATVQGVVPAVLESGPVTLRTATASTRVSSAEVNTTPTSYTPYAPAWNGSSAASVTLTGTYGGSTNDALTFTVTQVGVLGLIPYRVRVTNGAGSTTDTLEFTSTSGTKNFTLANGIGVAIGPGALSINDYLNVSVSATTGTSIAPTNAFNGTGANRPNLDSGYTITNGSLTINGVAVSVSASDTLDAVLARITASAADVTATYSAATDMVTLTRKTAGANAITLGTDTSGLLAALKLTGTTTTLGQQDDLTSPLSTVPGFGSVTSGWFVVDDTYVSIDPSTDSLQTILNRISSTTTATATRSSSTGKLSLTPDASGGTVTLGADQTGLYSLLGWKPAETFSVYERGRLRADAAAQVAATLDDVTKQLAGLRATTESGYTSRALGEAIGGYQALLDGLGSRDRTGLTRLAMVGSEAASDEARTRRLVALQASTDGFAQVLRASISATDDGYLDKVRDLFRRTVAALEDESAGL